jgi:hypothetical protein
MQLTAAVHVANGTDDPFNEWIRVSNQKGQLKAPWNRDFLNWRLRRSLDHGVRLRIILQATRTGDSVPVSQSNGGQRSGCIVCALHQLTSPGGVYVITPENDILVIQRECLGF